MGRRLGSIHNDAVTIFISYRRDDSESATRQLCNELARSFGGNQVFRDTRSIELGKQWTEVIDDNLRFAGVLVAVIGKRWLDSRHPDGTRRLDDPNDKLCHEIKTAIERRIPVIPVLVDGSTMPASSVLPEAIKPLAQWQAHALTDTHWDSDIGDLVSHLSKMSGIMPKPIHRKYWLAGLAATLFAVATVCGAWIHFSRARPASATAKGDNQNIGIGAHKFDSSTPSPDPNTLEGRIDVYDRFNDALDQRPPGERLKQGEAFTRMWLRQRNVSLTELKKRLKRLDFYKGKADDVFDYATADAIVAFQKEHGLKPIDGICGEICLGKLDELVRP